MMTSKNSWSNFIQVYKNLKVPITRKEKSKMKELSYFSVGSKIFRFEFCSYRDGKETRMDWFVVYESSQTGVLASKLTKKNINEELSKLVQESRDKAFGELLELLNHVDFVHNKLIFS